MLCRSPLPSILYFSIYGLTVLFALFLLYQQRQNSCSNSKELPSRTSFTSNSKDGSTEKVSPYQPDEYTQSVRQTINSFKDLRLPQDSPSVRPFIRNKSYYRVAPKYNLSACIIEKAMCTLTQSIFCYLYDPLGFIQNNRTIPTENWDGRFCENRNEIRNTQEKRLLFPAKPPTIFMVREPIERFISAFIDKCINLKLTCFNCEGDIFCAIEKFHEEILKINAEHWEVIIPKDSYISQTIETQHMAPANWMCDLFEESDNYIFVKYGETPETLQEMYNQLKNIYLVFGVEEKHVDYIMNSITTRTSHATKSSKTREEYSKKLRNSPKHLKMLNEVYEYDYKIFGFSPL